MTSRILKIAPKLTLGYLLIALLVVVVGAFGIWVANYSENSSHHVIKDVVPTSDALQDVRYYGLHIVLTSTEILYLNTESVAALADDNGNNNNELDELKTRALLPFDSAMARYAAIIHRLFPDETGDLEHIRTLGEQLKAGGAEVVALAEHGAPAQEQWDAKQRLEVAEGQFVNTIDAALAKEHEELNEAHRGLEGVIARLKLAIGGVSLLAFLIAALSGVRIARAMSRPIITLKDAALALGKGNLDVRVDIPSRDEIGTLAHCFNEMAEALNTSTVSRSYVDNIIGSMPDSLIVLDAGNRIVRVNAATLQLLGYAEEELLGQPASLVAEIDFLPGLNAAATTLYNGGDHAETFYHTRDGRALPMLFSIATLRSSEGEIQGLMLVGQDITELKNTQQSLLEKARELQRSNKELDQFAYVVSHDLKAPLRAIANLSQWIEEDLSDEVAAETRQQLETLRGRVRRLEGLINGILEYSRIGRVTVDIDQVDVRTLLREIIDSMPVPAGFTFNIAEEMPQLVTARVRLGQVFGNLISNAIKYSGRPDGRVDIGVRDCGDFYEFSVSDNGPGIAPQFHEKVFIIFQTLAARDKVESTGIGLTLVKKIVEECGGEITLESEEGHGALFRFTWPKQMQRKKAA